MTTGTDLLRVLPVAANGPMRQTLPQEVAVALLQMVMAGNKTAAGRLLVRSIQMLMENQVQARTVVELAEQRLREDPAMVSGETENTSRVLLMHALSVNSSAFPTIPRSNRLA